MRCTAAEVGASREEIAGVAGIHDADEDSPGE
jgi:hypothetical protein